ncbi:MATE family efflux transporter [candidate division WOR-3 bacterium]|nr:MATE family efflux transporter [candidate division WOR-3 bacterium]
MVENTRNFDPENITYGNIWNLSWPVMVSSLAFTLLDVTDMFWIGKLGHISVAAVSMVGSFLFILISSMTLVSSGAIAFVSRAYGSKDTELLKKSISISLFFSILIALVLIVPSILFSDQILSFFGAKGEVLSQAKTYMRIMLLGFAFLFILDIMYNIFFGTGDSKTPMKLTITTLLINILLDPFFIFGWFFFPRLETSGAAIASSVSILIGFSLFTFFFLKKFGAVKPSFQKDLSISFLKTGIPAFFFGITRPVTGMLIYKIVSFYGDISIAAFGIGSRIIGVTFIYMDGLMMAVQTFIGQLLGKKILIKPER